LELNRAISLANFINERDPRFSANVLDFSDQGWVIVRDCQANRHLEPIADPHDYVRRAQQGTLDIDDTYHSLITDWMTEDDSSLD
jgi:hypothetical protein